MKLNNAIKITTAALLITLATCPAYGGNGNGKGNGGGDDGGNDPGGISNARVYLEQDNPGIPYVESESFDNKGQVVFYGHMNLKGFNGQYNNGDPCIRYDEPTEGIIVIHPLSNNNPEAAELIFWYRDILDSGDTIQHLLTMTGTFEDSNDWPPAGETTVRLETWEFSAENKKAQRQDCAGDGIDDYEIVVTRVP